MYLANVKSFSMNFKNQNKIVIILKGNNFEEYKHLLLKLKYFKKPDYDKNIKFYKTLFKQIIPLDKISRRTNYLIMRYLEQIKIKSFYFNTYKIYEMDVIKVLTAF